MRFLIDEHFIVATTPERDGTDTTHSVEANTPEEAAQKHATTTEARILGITHRLDGTTGATLWRDERIYRLTVKAESPARTSP